MFQDVSLQVQRPHTPHTGNYSFTWASTHLCSILTQPLLPCGRETLQFSFQTSFLSLLSHFPVVFSLFLLMFFLAFSFSHLLTKSCRSQQAFVGVSTYIAGTNTHSHKQISHNIQVFLVLIYR